MTLLEQLRCAIERQKSRGCDTAWLSPANLEVLGRRPGSALAAPPSAGASAVFTAAPPVAPQAAPIQRAGNDVETFSNPPVQVMQPPVVSVPAPPRPVVPAADVSGAGWDELVAACQGCSGCCLAQGRNTVVIEDGCRNAPLMFIGEGPGADEDAQGVPFVGRAGQLLTAMIRAMGRDRASTDPATAVYIANIVKCRPPGNRNPADNEAGACIGYLKRQIELAAPKVIVLLGAVPLQYLLGVRGIMANRGKWREYNGIPVMPTFHPAYLLRFEKYQEDFKRNKLLVWHDLQEVMKRLRQ